jgi:hypothetical protein
VPVGWHLYPAYGDLGIRSLVSPLNMNKPTTRTDSSLIVGTSIIAPSIAGIV